MIYAASEKYQQAIKDYNVASFFAETMIIKQQDLVYNDLGSAYIRLRDYFGGMSISNCTETIAMKRF